MMSFVIKKNFLKLLTSLSASLWLCLLILVLFPAALKGYKFLGVLHFASKSHYIVGSSLLKALANKGHEVTVVTSFTEQKPIKNYNEIPLKSVLKIMDKKTDELLETNKNSLLTNIVSFHQTGLRLTDIVLNDPNVQSLMTSNQTFDAVICEVFLGEALYGLSEHFKAPLIGLGTFGAISWNTDMVGSPSPPSYVPYPLLPLTDHMSFWERLENLAVITFERLFLDLYYLPRQSELYRKYFPHLEKSMLNIRRNAALVLLNTHYSLTFTRPYVPNQIEVGGMHITPSNPPYPKDLVDFIDNASEGVIYFSMGSNIKSKKIPVTKREEILSAFRQLKQKVLWKFEDPYLPNKPDNVLIRDWFPQDFILAQPQVKAFVTHGGLLSIQETVFYGKPIVALPIFGDQFLNAAISEREGFGIVLDYKNLTAIQLKTAIERVVNDKQYKEKAGIMSVRFKDRPEHPMEKALFWVEFVAKHKGARFLHCAGMNLNFIEYHNLDALFVLYIGSPFFIVLQLWIMYKLIAFCLSYCLRGKISKKLKKDKVKKR
uniref:Uncharacterized protein n=1 Tax=Glossina morsitans morsitans TaxID=37546 RepID=A0A1B0GEE6_GLOMM